MKKYEVTVTSETKYFVEAEDDLNAVEIATLLPLDWSRYSFSYVRADDPNAIQELVDADEGEETFYGIWDLIDEGIIDTPEDVKQSPRGRFSSLDNFSIS